MVLDQNTIDSAYALGDYYAILRTKRPGSAKYKAALCNALEAIDSLPLDLKKLHQRTLDTIIHETGGEFPSAKEEPKHELPKSHKTPPKRNKRKSIPYQGQSSQPVANSAFKDQIEEWGLHGHAKFSRQVLG